MKKFSSFDRERGRLERMRAAREEAMKASRTFIIVEIILGIGLCGVLGGIIYVIVYTLSINGVFR